MSTVAVPPSAAPTPYSQPCPAAAIDRRKSVRVTLPKGGVPVACYRGPRVLLSKANALGERGAFIFTTSPFPLGSSFTLEFAVAHNLRLHARVRCTIPSLGMGVEFLTLNDESKSRLQQWLASSM
jgi:hypothetical protein